MAITIGAAVYMLFRFTPALDGAGNMLGPVMDRIFPFFVFLTLLVTFCKVDFHDMRPRRWHLYVLLAQMALVAVNVGIIFVVEADMEQKIMWESVLTCVIGPSASAAPVVTGKLGGNVTTMTTFTLLSSLVCAVMIPAVFPVLEDTVHVSFMSAFLIILEKLAMVMVLPLLLGYVIRHHMHRLHQAIVERPNLGFYCWGLSLSIVTGITVKNIFNSSASTQLLVMIAVMSLAVSILQFAIGRAIGRSAGEEINSGQAMFQKNTALNIWVAYMYLNPVASVGSGCYVLWQNIINSVELWQHAKKEKH